MNPLVSIVVPVYNAESYIKHCVTSIRNQSYQEIEIILVNDGSLDSSKLIIDDLCAVDSRITACHIDNGGVSNARNIGMKLAKGKYIIFIDADDYITEDYVSYMHELMLETNSEFVLSTEYFLNNKDTRKSNETIHVWNAEMATANLLYPKLTVGCWNKMYDLDFLKANNIRFQTDLFFGEGLRFITDVSQKASSIGVGNRKVYYYRLNDTSCTAVHDVVHF